MSSVLSPEHLAALAKWDTPTVCNAIELFEVRPRNTGYMNSVIRSLFTDLPPMVGYALTSTFDLTHPRLVDHRMLAWKGNWPASKRSPVRRLPSFRIWMCRLPLRHSAR